MSIPCAYTEKVLPTVYDNSLSYEEQINKILYYLHHFVVSDEELKDMINLFNSMTFKNVAGLLGYGSLANPIDLQDLGIDSHTMLYFPKGTYWISPLTISGLEYVTFVAPEAEIYLTGDFLLNASNCPHLTWYGGCIDGNNQNNYGFQLMDGASPVVDSVSFRNMGSVSQADVCMLKLLGDNTGFRVQNCSFTNCTSGVEYSDGFIHAYGMLIGRRSSTKSYPLSGMVSECIFNNIAGMDTTVKGDGEGIFINIPPYLDEYGNRQTPNPLIEIEKCAFYECKKRGIKTASHGVEIRNCDFQGASYLASIECQYGHNYIRHCRVINTSDWNRSVTSCIVIDDGGMTIEDTYMSAPYTYVDPETEETKNTYHPGVRLNTRLPASPVPDNEPWDTIYITRCTMDGVSRAVFANDSNAGASGKYTLSGLEIRECVFGGFNQPHCVDISSTIFLSIDVFKLVDYKLSYGNTRNVVKQFNNDFTYPIGIGVPVLLDYENYSCYWRDEPQSGYDGLPTTVTHAKIVWAGSNMGGQVTYKEFMGSKGSFIRAEKNPGEIDQTLSLQLLYNSRAGDILVNYLNGTVWICRGSSSDTDIGIWQMTWQGGNPNQ